MKQSIFNIFHNSAYIYLYENQIFHIDYMKYILHWSNLIQLDNYIGDLSILDLKGIVRNMHYPLMNIFGFNCIDRIFLEYYIILHCRHSFHYDLFFEIIHILIHIFVCLEQNYVFMDILNIFHSFYNKEVYMHNFLINMNKFHFIIHMMVYMILKIDHKPQYLNKLDHIFEYLSWIVTIFGKLYNCHLLSLYSMSRHIFLMNMTIFCFIYIHWYKFYVQNYIKYLLDMVYILYQTF